MLLDPFLDTSCDEDDERRTGDLLERNGVTRDEARRIREVVGEAMLRYNSLLWEWGHLGMFDLFLAHRPGTTSGRGIDEARFRELYACAQEIAGRATVRTPFTLVGRSGSHLVQPTLTFAPSAPMILAMDQGTTGTTGWCPTGLRPESDEPHL